MGWGRYKTRRPGSVSVRLCRSCHLILFVHSTNYLFSEVAMLSGGKGSWRIWKEEKGKIYLYINLSVCHCWCWLSFDFQRKRLVPSCNTEAKVQTIESVHIHRKLLGRIWFLSCLISPRFDRHLTVPRMLMRSQKKKEGNKRYDSEEGREKERKRPPTCWWGPWWKDEMGHTTSWRPSSTKSRESIVTRQLNVGSLRAF